MELGHPCAQRALAAELAILQQARPRSRNRTLNRCAFKVYRYVAGGLLDEKETTAALATVARSLGLDAAEARRTLASARTPPAAFRGAAGSNEMCRPGWPTGAPTALLTPTQVARLVGVVNPRYRALVPVGAYCDLRIGELAGRRRGRVDLLRGTVDGAEIVVEVRGQLHTGPPKARAGRGTVGLPRAVVEELAAHTGPVGPADAHVLTAERGAMLRTSNFRTKVWLPAVGATGLERLRPHDLRHTAVALWIAAGANP